MELTELNRNLILSIDVIPIPTDEAVREVENRLLGVETNIRTGRGSRIRTTISAQLSRMTWSFSARDPRSFLTI